MLLTKLTQAISKKLLPVTYVPVSAPIRKFGDANVLFSLAMDRTINDGYGIGLSCDGKNYHDGEICTMDLTLDDGYKKITTPITGIVKTIIDSNGRPMVYLVELPQEARSCNLAQTEEKPVDSVAEFDRVEVQVDVTIQTLINSTNGKESVGWTRNMNMIEDWIRQAHAVNSTD
jgi:hypothetical protein